MNVVETKKQMEACVAALRQKLPSVRSPDKRRRLIERARRDVLRIHKAFAHTLDERGSRPPFKTLLLWGDPVHARAGVGRALDQVTAAALGEIDEIDGLAANTT